MQPFLDICLQYPTNIAPCPRLRPTLVELAELKKVVAELIWIDKNCHKWTLNPVNFSLADQQVLGEERHRRTRPEHAFSLVGILSRKIQGYHYSTLSEKTAMVRCISLDIA